MRRTCARLVALPAWGLLIACLALAGCGGGSGSEDAVVALSTVSESPSGVPTLYECPVTKALTRTPTGEDEGNYGNGDIWTIMNPVYVVGHNSKVPWWHRVDGDLTVEGRRLDHPGPAVALASPLRSSTRDGRPFHASKLRFPTAGCWEVTASVGDTSLSLVVRAIVN